MEEISGVGGEKEAGLKDAMYWFSDCLRRTFYKRHNKQKKKESVERLTE